MKNKTPIGITIIAYLPLISIIALIITTLYVPLFLYNINVEYLINDPTFKFSILYAIIMIPITYILAIGLLKGIAIARHAAIILYLVLIGVAFLSVNILLIIASILVIYYLTRPNVKEYFSTLKSPLLS